MSGETVKPYVGMRFYHSRWLDPTKMPQRVPALFQVTGLRREVVYYAPVYIYKGGREEVSKKRECCNADNFHTVLFKAI